MDRLGQRITQIVWESVPKKRGSHPLSHLQSHVDLFLGTVSRVLMATCGSQAPGVTLKTLLFPNQKEGPNILLCG